MTTTTQTDQEQFVGAGLPARPSADEQVSMVGSRAAALEPRTDEKLKAQVRRSLPTLSLEQIRIASPCTVSWASMQGDERTRHCAQCDKQVHDLSKMTRAQGEALVSRGEKVCVRLWVRKDGTVLTQDCPVGLARVRQHLKRIGAIFGALLGWCVGLVGCTREPVMGEMEATPATGQSATSAPVDSSAPEPEPEAYELMGDVCEPAPVSTITTPGN